MIISGMNYYPIYDIDIKRKEYKPKIIRARSTKENNDLMREKRIKELKAKPNIDKYDNTVEMELIRKMIKDTPYTFDQVMSRNRSEMFTMIRFAIWQVLYEAGNSLNYIGRLFGGMDHSTIIHGKRKCQDNYVHGKPIIPELHNYYIKFRGIYEQN